MGLWDQVSSEKERIKRLSTEASTCFATACIGHAFASLYADFVSSPFIDRGKLKVAKDALDLLWTVSNCGDAREQLRAAYGRVAALEPGDDSPEQAVDGWVYCISGICGALESQLSDDVVETALYAAENAYLALRQSALTRHLKAHASARHRDGEADLEASCPELRNEVAYQLKCLKDCEAGASPEHHSLPDA